MKNWILLSVLGLCAVQVSAQKKIAMVVEPEGSLTKTVAPCPNCPKYFNDGVAVHEKVYDSSGIKPQKTYAGLQNLVTKKVLVKLSNTKYYRFEHLTHSRPFFLPVVKDFLADLGKMYAAECKKKGLRYVPFKITSGTRTTSSIRSLMEENANSIENSAHLRGKTLDISYDAFGGYNAQRKIFVDVLNRLRKGKRCFVKYESNGCLHLTVVS